MGMDLVQKRLNEKQLQLQQAIERRDRTLKRLPKLEHQIAELETDILVLQQAAQPVSERRALKSKPVRTKQSNKTTKPARRTAATRGRDYSDWSTKLLGLLAQVNTPEMSARDINTMLRQEEITPPKHMFLALLRMAEQGRIFKRRDENGRVFWSLAPTPYPNYEHADAKSETPVSEPTAEAATANA